MAHKERCNTFNLLHNLLLKPLPISEIMQSHVPEDRLSRITDQSCKPPILQNQRIFKGYRLIAGASTSTGLYCRYFFDISVLQYAQLYLRSLHTFPQHRNKNGNPQSPYGGN
jgi:hypothetical protein